jgi:hypothetical protein
VGHVPPLLDLEGFGHRQHTVTGAVEHPDGRIERVTEIATRRRC